MSSGLFYTCSIAENVFMIVMFFTWSKTSDLQWRRWITNIITASVVLLSFIGTLIHLIFTHRFFSKPRRVMPTYAAESVEVYQDGTIHVTIRFNAERPWKRLFTPGINHVGTSQGRMFARLQTRLILSWDQALPSLLTDPLFSLNKSSAVYILLRALDGFCGPPAQQGRGGGIKHSLFTS